MKLERLISITYKLLNNEVLSASALAEQYNVSQRTIYRDIEAICAAGIPVVSYQGANGGYGILDGYKMDRSLLGSYDVGSLISVLYGMLNVFDDERIQETIERLQTIEPEQQAQTLSLDIGSQWTDPEWLRRLRTAIQDRRVIQFTYVSAKNERSSRVMEPVRLLYKHGTWYLYGMCRVRGDYREFRISRMASLVVTTETFGYHRFADERKEWARAPDWQEQLETVTLLVSVDGLAQAMDQFPDACKKFNDDGSLTLTLSIYKPAEARWLWSALLSLGGEAEIVAPPELRLLMKTQIEKMLKRYAEV